MILCRKKESSRIVSSFSHQVSGGNIVLIPSTKVLVIFYIFILDNGGPAAGFDLNYASNWPLRGVRG